jgi:hypothetical protein
MTGASITLQVLYNTVRNESQPTRYAITPPEIILRHTLDWEIIAQHLQALQNTGFVHLEFIEKRSIVRLTEAGISYAKSAA